MQNFQEKCFSLLILALPYADGQMILGTHACDGQVVFVLLQEKLDTTTKPIGYCFRSLTSAEHAYHITQRWCHFIIWVVSPLRPYLEGTRFKIRTDHNSLNWILNLS